MAVLWVNAVLMGVISPVLLVVLGWRLLARVVEEDWCST